MYFHTEIMVLHL